MGRKYNLFRLQLALGYERVSLSLCSAAQLQGRAGQVAGSGGVLKNGNDEGSSMLLWDAKCGSERTSGGYDGAWVGDSSRPTDSSLGGPPLSLCLFVGCPHFLGHVVVAVSLSLSFPVFPSYVSISSISVCRCTRPCHANAHAPCHMPHAPCPAVPELIIIDSTGGRARVSRRGVPWCVRVRVCVSLFSLRCGAVRCAALRKSKLHQHLEPGRPTAREHPARSRPDHPACQPASAQCLLVPSCPFTFPPCNVLQMHVLWKS